MNTYETFVAFVKRALIPARARRFATLAASKKGQEKVLAGLDHDFERAVRPGVGRPVGQASAGKQPCYAFHPSYWFRQPHRDALHIRSNRYEHERPVAEL